MTHDQQVSIIRSLFCNCSDAQNRDLVRQSNYKTEILFTQLWCALRTEGEWRPLLSPSSPKGTCCAYAHPEGETNRSCVPKVSGVPFGERRCYKSRFLRGTICTQPFPEGVARTRAPSVRARFVRNEGECLATQSVAWHVRTCARTWLTFGEPEGEQTQHQRC